MTNSTQAARISLRGNVRTSSCRTHSDARPRSFRCTSRLGAAVLAALLGAAGSASADVKGPDWKRGDQEVIVLAGMSGGNPDMLQQQLGIPDRRDPYSYLICCSP